MQTAALFHIPASHKARRHPVLARHGRVTPVARGMFPADGVRPTSSDAEATVYRQLADGGLPPGWTAWHGLRVKTANGDEAEADLVLGVPGVGMLVLEVKGGAIRLEGGRWLQNGKPMDKEPTVQAARAARLIQQKVRERRPGCDVRFLTAVVFPDTHFSQPPKQGHLDGVVLGAQDLPFLQVALKSLADSLTRTHGNTRDERFMDVLHGLWGHTWVPSLTLGDRLKNLKRSFIQLGAEQADALDHVGHNARMLMLGGPGTGKTLVARELYTRLKAAGRKPVYLCFTRALAAAMRAAGMENAWTTREYAIRCLTRAGVAPGPGKGEAQWSGADWSLIPLQAAMDAVETLKDEADAVVVDEGQDLEDNDWQMVRAMAGDGFLWVFADPAQGFWEERALPKDLVLPSYRLTLRYRCPERLARFADRYRPQAAGVAAASVEPVDELRVVTVARPQDLEKAVGMEVAKALAQGLRRQDIVVLSLGGQQRTQLCARDNIAGHAVVRADAPNSAESLVADTFLRFKGLERPWVIVTELGLGQERYDVRMFTAVTRATLGCVVVASAAEVAGDARLVGR